MTTQPPGSRLRCLLQLDPGTQPCYVAAMPDIDSRLLIESMNDLNCLCGPGLPRPFEAPGINRFAGRRTEFDLNNRFRASHEFAELPMLFGGFDDSRHTPRRAHNRREPDHNPSVLDCMSGVLCGFPLGGVVAAAGEMADFPEKAS